MIKLNGIKKTIDDETILDGIDLTILPGLTCIIGDSGAGKSTLLNIIGAIDTATEGDVFFGDDITMKSISTIDDYHKNYVGFVFQDSNLVNGLTIEENLSLAVDLSGSCLSDEEQSVLIQKFNVDAIVDKKAEAVSGGEAQRAAIVRAIAKKVPILLADEPTGNLDYNNSKQVFSTFKELSKDRIILVVTHNEELANQFADRIIKIRDGSIINDTLPVESTCFSNQNVFLPDREEIALSKRYQRNLGKSNVLRMRKRFLSSVLTIGIALGLIGVVFLFFLNFTNQAKELNTIYYDADLVTYYGAKLGDKSPTSIVLGNQSSLVSSTMYSDVANSGMFKEIVSLSDSDYYLLPDIEITIPIKQINLDQFFKKRLMNDGVSGSFLRNENEIIIGQDIAKKIGSDKLIGKKISIMNDYNQTVTFTIVGINNNKNIDGYYYSYISANAFLSVPINNLPTTIYYSDTVNDSNQTVYTEDASGVIDTSEDFKIIFGKAPTKDGEIVVSVDIMNELIDSFFVENSTKFSFFDYYQPSPVLNKMVNTIFNQRVYISANDAYECRIVGVHGNDGEKVYISKQWATSVLKTKANCLECYFNSIDTAKDFPNSTFASKYPYISNYEERFEGTVSTMKIWGIMFGMIVLLSIFLCAFLIRSYVKIAMRSRSYEIGILRTLGMNNKEARHTLSFEIVLLGTAAWLISFCFLIIYYLLCFSTSLTCQPHWLIASIVLVSLIDFAFCFSFSKKEAMAVASIPLIDALKYEK